jgi:hypothetical protein
MVIVTDCDLDSLFRTYGISYVRKVEGWIRKSYRFSRGVDPASNSQKLEALIVARMMKSRTEFRIKGKSYTDEKKHLLEHVKVRNQIVKNVLSIKFGFGAGEDRFIPPDCPNPEEDPVGAFQCYNENSQTKIACNLAAQLAIWAAVGKWDHSGLLSRDHRSDWIPGDWGHVKNANRTRQNRATNWYPGQAGENIVSVGLGDIGNDVFWGHTNGRIEPMTIEHWIGVVDGFLGQHDAFGNRFTGKGELENWARYPRVGLDSQ